MLSQKGLKEIQKDEATIKLFLKDLIATAKGLGKAIQVPYLPLVALVEHAKENPQRYIEVKKELLKYE